MTLLSRALSYLSIAAFVLVGALTGHHGHQEFGQLPSTDHGAHAIAGVLSDAAHHDAKGQSDLDKTSCDFAHVSSCGMGQCCFPVPTVDLAHAKGVSPYWALDILAWERHEDRLEPPPPKWS